MRAGTFEEMVSDFKNGVFDLTDNGKCTQCGSCCGAILPMTDKEIEVIRRYIKKRHIKEFKHLIPLANPVLDITCPFLNTDKKTEKCMIYEVRPAICRCFICSEPNGALKHKELYDGVRKPVDVSREFFNEKSWPTLQGIIRKNGFCQRFAKGDDRYMELRRRLGTYQH